MPDVDPHNYTNIESNIRYAQTAERGKFHFMFLPDFAALNVDIEHEPSQMTLDPLLTLAIIVRETKKIGFVATGSSTFNEPYNLARQFKTLNVLSHGRAGWNAVPTSDPHIAANYGREIPPKSEKYERLHETIQLIQALWGSWEEDALILDKEYGVYANPNKIRPINLAGRYVGSQGPLPIPPSEQGQPVIVQAGGGGNGLAVAGRYASGVIGAVFTIEDARNQRNALREAAKQAGRDPDEVKFFAGFLPTLAPTRREALDRRLFLGRHTLQQRVAYLSQMIGVRLDASQLDKPLTEKQLAAARPSPYDPRSDHALDIARQGWSVRDIIGHGVIDYHPVVAGTPEEAADHMQEWFEAGACDGFWVSPDVYEDGLDAFVDGVVPILQDRGLFHLDYEGNTLREHLGVPDQYGLDQRLKGKRKQ